jgi:hypothetical protein
LQGTKGHVNQLGDFLSALSSLDEIPDLLDSFRSKLYQPSTRRELRDMPLRLQHLVHPFSALLSSYASCVSVV